jgi:hypothetical protein
MRKIFFSFLSVWDEMEMYYRGDKVGKEMEMVREMREDGDI